jgi:ribosomal protein S18 acetylase RimI-like enzyme
MVFKAVRLRALLDTPSAFSSTYAAESQLTDADWINRVAQWSSDRSTTYLAMDGAAPCGIVSGFLDKDDATIAHLASMWVAPVHRLGVGSQLVNVITDWARSRRVRALQLIVTSNNDTAIKFYERLGFKLTGKSGSYRNDPTLDDLEMIRSLSA